MALKSIGILDVLSNELVVQILHHGGCQDILRFATTCKHHYDIVTHSTSLQLHLELEANGLEIIAGAGKANTDYSVILEELRRYRDAWLDLKHDEPIKKDANARIRHWELNKGCFVAAVGDESPEYLHRIPLGDSTCSDLTNLRQQFQSFSVDSEQNLVVLAVPDSIHFNSQRISIQLRSTLDGMPHPLAHHPVLTILVDFEVPRGATAIEFDIMGHLLAVKITDFGKNKFEFVILDWRLGTLLQRIGSGTDQVACSFVYLDKDYILLASGTGFDETALSSLKLLVYDIYPKHRRAENEAITGPNYCLQDIAHSDPTLIFEFPEVDDRYRLSPLLFVRAGPIPGNVIYTQSTAVTHSRVSTLALSVSFNDYIYFMTGLDFRVFVDVNRLFRHISNSEHSSSTVIPWDEWGTSATRWFTDYECQGLQWDRMISGSRWVRTTDKREHKPPYELSVFDFNPRTVLRHAERRADNYVIAAECKSYQRSIGRVVSQGDRLKECIAVRGYIRNRHIKDRNDLTASVEIVGSDMPIIIANGFKTQFESRLPYRVVSKFEEICCRDWTIDGEHIVGITPCDVNPMMFGEESFVEPGNEQPKIVVFKIRA